MQARPDPDGHGAWQDAVLAGAGHGFTVGKLRVYNMVLYDANHRSNDFNTGPWAFRTGVRWDGMKPKNKNQKHKL